MTITLRTATATGATTKGSALSHAEMDANFTSLMAADASIMATVAGSAGASLVGYTPSGSAPNVRAVQAKLREVQVSVLDDSGVDPTGVSDSATGIQRVIDYVGGTLGGGIVFFPPGSYLIASTLTVGYSNVQLIGAGAGSFHYTGTSPNAATKLRWTGSSGGTMVSFSSSGSQWLSGCGFDGIYLHSGKGVSTNTAGKGLYVQACQLGRFIAIGEHFSTALLDTNISTSIGAGENGNTQQCYLEARGQQNASGDGYILRLDGAASGTNYNTNFCRVGLVDGNYLDSAGIHIGNADTNLFEVVRLFRESGGTAYGIVLAGSDTSTNYVARTNVFLNCNPGAGGVQAQGTGTVTNPAKNNFIFSYDTANAAPEPTIGTYTSSSTNPALPLQIIGNTNQGPLAVARDSSGTSYGAGPTDVSWNTVTYNYNSNFSTPSFTCTRPGKYRITWKLTYVSTVTVNDQWSIKIVATPETSVTVCTIAAAKQNTLSGSATMLLAPGDTVKLTITRDGGTGTFDLSSNANFNRFEIQYLGWW